MAGVEEMLEDCNDVKDITSERGGPGFSQWELEFLESVTDQFAERRTLTTAQEEKLGELWDKI